jgi:hypothetical protein
MPGMRWLRKIRLPVVGVGMANGHIAEWTQAGYERTQIVATTTTWHHAASHVTANRITDCITRGTQPDNDAPVASRAHAGKFACSTAIR